MPGAAMLALQRLALLLADAFGPSAGVPPPPSLAMPAACRWAVNSASVPRKHDAVIIGPCGRLLRWPAADISGPTSHRCSMNLSRGRRAMWLIPCLTL